MKRHSKSPPDIGFILCVSLFAEIPAPPEFSETDTTDFPEFDHEASDAYSPELSDWRNSGGLEYTGPDTPDGQNLPEFYSNGIITPAADAAPVFEDHDTPQPESSLPISQETPPQAG